MATTISIAGLDKAELVARLWEGAKSLRGQFIMGTIPCSEPLKVKHQQLVETARRKLPSDEPFFYLLFGRYIVTDFSGDEIDTSSYNKKNGEGVAERIIAQMRSEQ